MVHVGEVVPGGRQLLGVGVAHVAERVEAVRDEDRRRQVGKSPVRFSLPDSVSRGKAASGKSGTCRASFGPLSRR
jgi:hypothetical protein